MSTSFKVIVLFIALSLIYFTWSSIVHRSLFRTVARTQNTAQILLPDGQIKKEELPSVIELARKGDRNSVIRLRTHYRFSGQLEEFKKWEYFGMTPDESWAELENSIQELPETQKLLESLSEDLNE
jgi:hypothetical protein